MTAFAALTLVNNAASNVVFGPASIDANGVATWLSDDTIYDAKRRVTMSLTLPKNGSTVSRLKQRVAIPIMDAVDTSKKIAEAYCNIEFVMPKQATETNRLDLRRFAEKLLENAVTTAATQSFESIY